MENLFHLYKIKLWHIWHTYATSDTESVELIFTLLRVQQRTRTWQVGKFLTATVTKQYDMQMLGGKLTHHATHWLHIAAVGCLAGLSGVWLRVEESATA